MGKRLLRISAIDINALQKDILNRKVQVVKTNNEVFVGQIIEILNDKIIIKVLLARTISVCINEIKELILDIETAY